MASEFMAPVAETVLRDFSKTLHKNTSPQNEALTNDFDAIIDTLIKTAYDPEIGGGHRAAATNAICSLIGHVHSLGLSRPLDQSRWFDIFSIILDRSDSAKGKSMRQLLSVLIGLLAAYDTAEGIDIKNKSLYLVFRILLAQSDHVKVKPAFQVLSLYFTKRVISLELFTAMLRQFMNDDLGENVIVKPDDSVLQGFAQKLLNWVRYQDAAPSAGQTFCTFLKALAQREGASWSDASIPNPKPFWVEPLIASFMIFPEAANNFRHHLFPELFSSNVPAYVQFLGALGLHQYLSVPNSPRDGEIVGELKIKLLFIALQVGKETGIVLDAPSTQLDSLQIHGNLIFISDKAWSRLLRNCNSEVRLAGLSLTVSSALVTRPFTKGSLRCLKSSLPHLFMETDANTRGEVLTLIQRLVDRIKAATGLLQRTIDRVGKQPVPASPDIKIGLALAADESPGQMLSLHQAATDWLLRFLRAQFHPEAAYQRHVTTLRALLIVAKSGLDSSIPSKFWSKQSLGDVKWSFQMRIFDPWLVRSLYDLVMDPFEDVRTFSASLLEMRPTRNGDGSRLPVPLIPEYESTTLNFLRKAEDQMLKSGRADHADGVSRTYVLLFESADALESDFQNEKGQSWWLSKVGIVSHLLNQLDHAILMAKDDLTQAVTRFPMHGILASLRYIFDMSTTYTHITTADASYKFRWKDLHSRTVQALEKVWSCVRGVLCNDAPEGYVPDEAVEDESITTKDILSYSWRALKEASSLVRVIAQKAPIGDGKNDMLDKVGFETLSTLTFTELAELRHRGAFSAVAQAFAACCSRCNSLNHMELLDKFYQETLLCIRAKGSATTRRSAGLPSLVTGILGASPGGALFHQAIKDLQLEAEATPELGAIYGDPLPQVHALNCLKAIFISTILGPSSEQYIVSALDIAGRCLRSKIWAIRNCGLMLFRALIDRLLGSTDSQNLAEDGEVKTAQISYNDYPNLLDIVVSLLTPDLNHSSSTEVALESVFPALKILQRMPPPADQQRSVRNLVFKLCESPHWHVRDMAARTFSRLIPHEELLVVLTDIVPRSLVHQNHVHGRLLCISYLVQATIRKTNPQSSATLPDPKAVFDLLQSQHNLLYEDNICPYTRSAYLDIMNEFDTVSIGHSQQEVLIDQSSRNRSSGGDQSDIESSEVDMEMAQVLYETPSARKSLALHFILRLLLCIKKSESPGNNSHSKSALNHLRSLLTRLEADEVITLAEVLDHLVNISSSLPRTCVNLLASTLSRMATEADESRVAIRSRKLLAKLYEEVTQEVHAPSLSSIRDTFTGSTIASPSLVESTLLLWGLLLNEACRSQSSQPVPTGELSYMLSVLERMTHESRPFDLRYAAALSLRKVPNLWTLSITGVDMRSIRTKAIIIAYDILNDDDDEIREVGSVIASNIRRSRAKSQQSETCVPLVAGQQLVAHLAIFYQQSEDLCIQAIQRMTTSRLVNDRLELSASQRLINATAENTALFVVEKQNLFIDQYRETILWSQVLEKISTKAISTSAATALSTWVFDGLTLLSEKAREELDGPLGWTSKPDVFVFGIQVICAADVVLNWRARTKKVPVEGKMIRELLVRILVDGRKNEVHGAWLEKIENILVEDMRTRVVGIGKVVEYIADAVLSN